MRDETFWQFFKSIIKYPEVQAILATFILLNLFMFVIYGLLLIGLIKLGMMVL